MALNIAEEINNTTMIALCTYNLGTAYSKSGRFKKALGYLEKLLPRFEELDSQFQLAGNLLILAETYEALGNYKKAYRYQKRRDTLQDVLHSERNEKILKEVETEYQVE